MDTLIAGVLGWSGTIGTFTAYLLLARGRIAATSTAYAAMNAVGGTLGAIGSTLYQAWPAAASNGVWAVLGLYTLACALRRPSPLTPAATPAAEPATLTSPIDVITRGIRIVEG